MHEYNITSNWVIIHHCINTKVYMYSTQRPCNKKMSVRTISTVNLLALLPTLMDNGREQ